MIPLEEIEFLTPLEFIALPTAFEVL